MKETEYAYGVSRIRVHELTLLSNQDLEQIISSDSFDSIVRLLEDKGWEAGKFGTDIVSLLENESEKTWAFLKEAIPDIGELACLIISNDFQNIKAVIKSYFSKANAQDYFIKPCSVDFEIISDAVSKKNFELLPEKFREPAQNAFDAVLRNTGGQNVDMILDKASLETAYELSKKSGSSLLINLSLISCDIANIKSAYRCAKLKKEKGFMERALCDFGKLEKQELIANALVSVPKLLEYLAATDYRECAAMLKVSTAEFEKQSDNLKMREIMSAKYKAFGIDPFVAYYLAKETEIKNMRVILNAKINKLSSDIIRKRVREMYV